MNMGSLEYSMYFKFKCKILIKILLIIVSSSVLVIKEILYIDSRHN